MNPKNINETNKTAPKPELKIIADHLRSSCFLIADGILPSNEGRGYVLRRIMRRGMRQAYKLGAKSPLMHRLVDDLILEMGEAYPELIRARDLITSTLLNEEEKFYETLEKGLKLLDEEILNLKKSIKSGVSNELAEVLRNCLRSSFRASQIRQYSRASEAKRIETYGERGSTENAVEMAVEGRNREQFPKLSGAIAFKLYDTFGFPLDLTEDICRENQLAVDLEGFNLEMEEQKQRAKKSWIGSGEKGEEKLFFDLKEKFGATTPLYHQATICEAKILAIIVDGQEFSEISSITEGKNKFLILDQSCFYPTSGGQKGDDGFIIKLSEFKPDCETICENLQNRIEISETRKMAALLFIHQISNCHGSFKTGEKIAAIVNSRNRQLRAQNHSATHLLHKALKQVLGNSVSQKGSNVDFSNLTFDFNLSRAMAEAEIQQVEELVNFYIRQNSAVSTREMELEEAKNSGAEMLFGEKYEEKVRVVAMGPSAELCGGTHVRKTGDIGTFAIISENGVASGVRRITAKSGFYAIQHYKIKEQRLLGLLESLKIKPEFSEEENETGLKNCKIGFDDLAYFAEEKKVSVLSNHQQELLKANFFQANKIGEEILAKQKGLEKEILQLKKQLWNLEIAEIANQKIITKSGEINLASHCFKNTESKDLREISASIKALPQFSSQQILAIFGEKDGKIALCLSISNDLINLLDASKLISPMIEKIGGKGGGGKKDFAMGAGVSKNGINSAIEALKTLIQQN